MCRFFQEYWALYYSLLKTKLITAQGVAYSESEDELNLEPVTEEEQQALNHAKQDSAQLSLESKAKKSNILFKCESNLSLAYMKLSKQNKALQSCKKALGHQPNNIKILCRIIKILTEQQNTEMAMAAIEKVLRLDPVNQYATSVKVSVVEKDRQIKQSINNQYKNAWKKVESSSVKKWNCHSVPF